MPGAAAAANAAAWAGLGPVAAVAAIAPAARRVDAEEGAFLIAYGEGDQAQIGEDLDRAACAVAALAASAAQRGRQGTA